jgi:DNA-binding MarR family transcriptional regulator/N-acetylglutamate synthase-like GNAT family acetyltransferase
VRRFNRFYTARADLLGDQHLGSAFSLGEMRLLFELAHRRSPTAADLRRDLRLDKGYVSRVLHDFRRRGLISRTASKRDGREALLTLTPKGREAFAPLNKEAAAQMAAMLGGLAPAAQETVVTAMETIERALGVVRGPIALRHPRPGDLGWVVHRHGALYAAEYGYDHRFEGLVARIVGEFTEARDPKRERCWIAEQDGARVGCVFLVRKSSTVAKLRLLLIEPSARGQGLGQRLVGACTAFARGAGFKAIELWTQSELVAARTLYEREGYTLVDSAKHAMFGKACVSETWRLTL